jgi:DNA adenine methylase
MIVSVNDIPEMRKAFDGLNMRRVAVSYSVGGGAKQRKFGESIVRNFD